MAKLILGVFPNHREADRVVREFEAAGVSAGELSVVAPESVQRRVVAKDSEEVPAHDTAIASSMTGGVTGGLAGLITGAVATSGLFVGGPVAVLAGLGLVALTTATGGAVGVLAGGIVGALVGLGVPEVAARYHELAIEAGGVLLGIEDDKLSEREVRQRFGKHGAEQVVAIDHGAIPIRIATPM